MPIRKLIGTQVVKTLVSVIGSEGDISSPPERKTSIQGLSPFSGEATLEKLSSLQAGTLGELLTVAKLNTLGLAAYMSPEGAPGHDVIVVVDGQPRPFQWSSAYMSVIKRIVVF